MALKEFKDLSVDELNERVSKLKRELMDMRIQATGGKLDKPHQIRLVRRDVARLLTALRQQKALKGSVKDAQ